MLINHILKLARLRRSSNGSCCILSLSFTLSASVGWRLSLVEPVMLTLLEIGTLIEFAVLVVVVVVLGVSVVTLYERRLDMLYGPYLRPDDGSKSP